MTPVRDSIFQQEPYLQPKENFSLADRDGTLANYNRRNNIEGEEGDLPPVEYNSNSYRNISRLRMQRFSEADSSYYHQQHYSEINSSRNGSISKYQQQQQQNQQQQQQQQKQKQQKQKQQQQGNSKSRDENGSSTQRDANNKNNANENYKQKNNSKGNKNGNVNAEGNGADDKKGGDVVNGARINSKSNVKGQRNPGNASSATHTSNRNVRGTPGGQNSNIYKEKYQQQNIGGADTGKKKSTCTVLWLIITSWVVVT